MSLLHDDANKAKQHCDRLKDTLSNNKDFIETATNLTVRVKEGEDKGKQPGRSVAFDLLTLHTINTQTTKTYGH